MFKRMLDRMGLGGGGAPPPPAPGFAPYREPTLNQLYNLLFCDDLELFRQATQQPRDFWVTLLAPQPDRDALSAIANDAGHESRVRALAYHRLRGLNVPVPPKELLGVIVEVGLEGGLDVLAAFADGRVRYFNQTGKASIFETAPPEVAAKVGTLLAVAKSVVDRIGPWDKARLPPPSRDHMRMSFLVSDGLYFGQGTIVQMQSEAIGGPVVAAAVDLLNAVVAAATHQPAQ